MWLAALLVAGILLAGMELSLRSQGHQPSVVDDKLLWACRRRNVYDVGDRRPVVLLGGSRIQLGFVPEVFERRFPRYRIVQLAAVGTRPVPFLNDLAEDEDFTGIVICSILPDDFLRRNHGPRSPYIDYYRDLYANWGRLDELLNRTISTVLQTNLAILNPNVKLVNIAKSLVTARSLPRPAYLITHADRSRSADYTRVDLAHHRAHRIERARSFYEDLGPIDPADWLQQALEVERMVRLIQARGGRVVFVRYISTDEHYELDEKAFPKERYWDRFAALTSAVTIHFADVPGLRGYRCPDTSHLDYRDAPAFTSALADELVRRGVIQP